MTDETIVPAIVSGISYIIPAFNEEDSIVATLERLRLTLAATGLKYEIIVVDDGSCDQTRARARSVPDTIVVGHPINTGYGSAIKTGILCAQYEWIGIVDADGTYPIEKLGLLIEKMRDGYDMAVAAREGVYDGDRPLARVARRSMLAFINVWISGRIEDPNSGFRLFTREFVVTFFPFLCNTFSFTTSSTVFAIGEGYFVAFVPMEYSRRIGRSKVRHFRDSLRMMQLVMQGITFFNPVKFFLILAGLMILGVDLPALLAASAGASGFAAIYALAGTATVVLIGLGVLGDIFRVATTTRVNKKRSIVRDARAQSVPPS